MSFFEDDDSKQPKERGPRKPRRKNRQKKECAQKQSLKTQLQKQAALQFPQLRIKTSINTITQEQVELPLEEFVDKIYSTLEGDRHHNKIIQSFLEEDDEGHVQYKLKLVNPSQDRLNHLATQMKYRINESRDGAQYRIGVQDNGKPIGLPQEEMLQSLKTICFLANKIHCDAVVEQVSEGLKGLIVILKIQKRHRQGVKMQIRLLLFGQSGSGKSTLLGVLKSGQKDDGKGYARIKVFTHKHEFMTGATMTKSHHVIGFDLQGKLYNQSSMMSLDTWFDNANKLLSFIDVGGHKRAQKQLVSSLCSFFPQYALWVISGRESIEEMKSDHSRSCLTTSNLQLAAIFNLPLIVVITHLDLMNSEEEQEALYRTKESLRTLYPDKTPCVIKQMEYAVLFSRITSTEDVIPIFLISSVTGKNIDLLTNFFNLLTSVSEIKNNEEMSTEYSISDKYVVDGNIILAGTVIKGTIKKGQILHIGPDTKGSFRAIAVVSIECLRVPVKLAKCGQICTVAIRLLNYSKQWLQKYPNAIRRGMVLIESKCNPKAAYEFLAQVICYSKQQIKITDKCEPVVNTLTTRQICNIVNLKNVKEKEVFELEFSKKKSRSIDNLGCSSGLHKKEITPKKNQMPERKGSLVELSASLNAKGKKKNINKSIDLGTKKISMQKFNEMGKQPSKAISQENSKEILQQIPKELPEQTNNLKNGISKEQSTQSSKELSKEIPKDNQKQCGKQKARQATSPILPNQTSKPLKLHPIAEQTITRKKRQAEEIRFSDKHTTKLRLRFKYYPEYITVGQRLVINQLKLIGRIIEIYY